MVEYHLKLENARFAIRTEPLGRWDLYVNDVATLTFPTPEEAAKTVHAHESGWVEWDMMDADAPEDLSGWEKIES